MKKHIDLYIILALAFACVLAVCTNATHDISEGLVLTAKLAVGCAAGLCWWALNMLAFVWLSATPQKRKQGLVALLTS